MHSTVFCVWFIVQHKAVVACQGHRLSTKAISSQECAAVSQARQPRGRVRPPRQFAAFADPGGELVSLQRWRTAIARLQDGRYADEHVRPLLTPQKGE